MKPLLIFLIALLLALPVFGEPLTGDALENRVREIANQLRCPTCQSQSVKDSEAGLSVNMKAMIQKMLVEGKSEAEILAFFEQRYGEWILRNPKKSGFNLLLWGLPGVILMVALGLVYVKAKKQQLIADPYSHSLSAAEMAEVERDLKRIDEEA
ncbi:MAG: hypothetical protein A2527_06640 [Candidatus Lambdaproteobacteria bacterium RIFOXYD2_FULL_50_16]|uniref:Cytochrome c-type biogenesis protein n=1 Tax=Candidatus Lambdaproteobacteria bacterium RIFOXYD2_FULL_50_16 TaxID=1817772 RepID=A0A1F6GBM6_9PROT|nr:MAG: hypothetical protein A2527_06640 [Candidatus Lambdaproteobacteria bacterium RIFOXYD2_FULL_50_16]